MTRDEILGRRELVALKRFDVFATWLTADLYENFKLFDFNSQGELGINELTHAAMKWLEGFEEVADTESARQAAVEALASHTAYKPSGKDRMNSRRWLTVAELALKSANPKASLHREATELQKMLDEGGTRGHEARKQIQLLEQVAQLMLYARRLIDSEDKRKAVPKKRLSAAELRVVKDLFQALDADESGSLSYEELRQGMATHTLHGVAKEKIHLIIEAQDTNKDGKIDYFEFVQMMAQCGGPGRLNKAAQKGLLNSERCLKDPEGGHVFKFGKCSTCGLGEGALVKPKGGECPEGGKHVFHFAKCTKCRGNEGGILGGGG